MEIAATMLDYTQLTRGSERAKSPVASIAALPSSQCRELNVYDAWHVHLPSTNDDRPEKNRNAVRWGVHYIASQQGDTILPFDSIAARYAM